MTRLPDWTDISYLARGNVRQQHAYRALEALDIFTLLRAYNPILTGTFPIGIDIEQSDLDIICEAGRLGAENEAKGLAAFEDIVREAYGECSDFRIERTVVKDIPTVFARFVFDGLPMEIFGQPQPVSEQNAYRHLVVEARLLGIGGNRARREIRKLKRNGLKTEPAFARYFHLEGDPYEVLLRISRLEDDELREAVLRC